MRILTPRPPLPNPSSNPTTPMCVAQSERRRDVTADRPQRRVRRKQELGENLDLAGKIGREAGEILDPADYSTLRSVIPPAPPRLPLPDTGPPTKYILKRAGGIMPYKMILGTGAEVGTGRNKT